MVTDDCGRDACGSEVEFAWSDDEVVVGVDIGFDDCPED